MQIFISSLIAEELRIFCFIFMFLLTHFMKFNRSISIKPNIASRNNLKNNSCNAYIATMLNYGTTSRKLERNQLDIFVIQFKEKKEGMSYFIILKTLLINRKTFKKLLLSSLPLHSSNFAECRKD